MFTQPTINSEFTYEVVRSLATQLTVNSSFTWRIQGSRSISTLLESSNYFSGAVIRLDVANTPLIEIADPPRPVPGPTLPHNIQDKGNRAQTFFQFWYNSVLLLQLNAPDFGDTETSRLIREKKYTRGLNLITFAEASWGDQRIYDYSFSYMNVFEKETLLLILRNTLGLKITIVDHLGVARVGFILTPESDVFEAVPGGFSASIRFQEVTDS